MAFQTAGAKVFWFDKTGSLAIPAMMVRACCLSQQFLQSNTLWFILLNHLQGL
jgi:hypothetical protein